MLLTIATIIPSVAIAALLALYFGYIARGCIDWPMLLDGVLLALYIWRPSIPALAVVAFLGSIRHIQPWALEFASWFHVQDYQGWTIRFWFFLLPGLRDEQKPSVAPVQTIALPPMVEAKREQPAPDAELPLLLGEGFKLLNGDPTAPHVGVIGATRLGKTTFVGVLLAHRQGNDLVIATPKSEIDDPWFGADAARPAAGETDLDYSPVEQAITNVHKEMLRRNMPGVRDRSGITLVLDEWPELAEIPGVVRKVVQIIRRGASAGIRLIFIATDVNVRSWKMDGMAGVLDNLVFARVEDGRRWSLGRLDPNWHLVSPWRLDTGQVHGLAARVSLASRGWAGVRGSVPDSLLGGLPGGRVPAGGGGGETPPQTLQTNGQSKANPNAEARIALYMQWRGSGITSEQARVIRQSTGNGLDDAEWAEAGKRNKQSDKAA
jgi:hypothetical protein